MHASLERGRHLGMEEVEGVKAEPVSPPPEVCRACWWRWRWVHEAVGINGRPSGVRRRCAQKKDEGASRDFRVGGGQTLHSSREIFFLKVFWVVLKCYPTLQATTAGERPGDTAV